MSNGVPCTQTTADAAKLSAPDFHLRPALELWNMKAFGGGGAFQRTDPFGRAALKPWWQVAYVLHGTERSDVVAPIGAGDSGGLLPVYPRRQHKQSPPL